jgi:uncharacterized protein (DUF983 family)
MATVTFIQWKGTDICMDFWCPECGAQSHFDGMFGYAIKCSDCGSFFEMPTDVQVKKLDAEPPTYLESIEL